MRLCPLLRDDAHQAACSASAAGSSIADRMGLVPWTRASTMTGSGRVKSKSGGWPPLARCGLRQAGGARRSRRPRGADRGAARGREGGAEAGEGFAGEGGGEIGEGAHRGPCPLEGGKGGEVGVSIDDIKKLFRLTE